MRQIRKIKDKRTRDMIYYDVGTLQSFPDCMNVKKLQGCEKYRLRVNQWRVIFRDSPDILYIEEVKRRDEHTY